MRELKITENDAGQRVDRFLLKAVPKLPASLMQKYIRTKHIKLNGSRAARDTRLKEGDILALYIPDEFFDPIPSQKKKTLSGPPITIVYEDENILLCDKRPGLSVHPHQGAEYGRTLIDGIQAYLLKKGEWNPDAEHSFAPALCNRIDRNTGGIVIAAKNAETLRIINAKIRSREIDKRYLAIIQGKISPASGALKGYLFKDSVKNRVYITKKPQPGAHTCETEYRTLTCCENLSLVECKLVTGRTHQIRAQFAAAGHPLLGDGKYGKLSKNAKRKYQALYSYKITFAFRTDAGRLSYLSGQTFLVKNVDFVEEYFPEALQEGLSGIAKHCVKW